MPRGRASGPLTGPGVLSRLLPFLVAGAVTCVSLALPTTNRDATSGVIAGGLTTLIVATCLIVPWRRIQPRFQAAPVLAFFPIIALLRQAQGASISGFAALLLLPVVWFALYGSRRQVWIGVAGVALTMTLPIVVIGGDDYPSYAARPAVILVVVAAMVGLAVSRLVTHLAEREQTMAQTAGQLNAVLSAATEYSVIGTDAAGRVTVFNLGAQRMLGYLPDEVLGRSPLILHDEAEILGRARELGLAPGVKVLASKAAEGGAERRRWTYVRKDGSSLPVELTVTPMRDPDGRITGFIEIAEDITKRILAEQALRDTEASLAVTARIVREMQSGADARTTIVAAVGEIAAAAHVFLFEPEGDTHLVLTSSLGGPSPANRIALDGPPSGVVTAYLRGQRVFVPDAFEDQSIQNALARLLKVRSILFEPILQNGRVTGVLLAAWQQAIPDLSSRFVAAVSLLADEAAVALEHESMLRQLRESATTDSLTGIPNRRAWDERIAHEVENAQRLGHPLVIALLDLDLFKAYNDRFGHGGGDELLTEFASSMVSTIRGIDFVARWGGEEFAVALPGCSLKDAHEVADRVRRVVPAGQTCSIGLAVLQPGEGPEALVMRADAALYAAKEGGRDRVEVAPDGELVRPNLSVAAPAPVH